MKILITAGCTQTPIDQVRAITNIFKGSTGWAIAQWAALYDNAPNDVTLLTSDPFLEEGEEYPGKLRILKYRTYDELYALMEDEIRNGGYDAIVHSSAVSDYKVAGVYVPVDYDEEPTGGLQVIMDPVGNGGKVSGSHEELFLRLTPTEKIVDRIKDDWGFKGVLVKFKLQVGLTDKKLLDIAIRSRAGSSADIIVANCLEWAKDWAYICYDKRTMKTPEEYAEGLIYLRDHPGVTLHVARHESEYREDKVARAELPRALLARIAEEFKERELL